MSMYEIIKRANEFELNRVYANSRDFINLIEELQQEKDNMSISELITTTLKKSGYIKALEEEDSKEAENRIENLNEFMSTKTGALAVICANITARLPIRAKRIWSRR